MFSVIISEAFIIGSIVIVAYMAIDQIIYNWRNRE